MHHDGIMFKPALDVSQGKMVFRDTFTQYGGVTVLLQAAAIKIFGPYLLVIRVQTALMYGGAYWAFWSAWRRIIPSWLAAFMCIVGSLMAPDSIASTLPWSSVYAAFFQGLALLLAIRYFESARPRELVWSGVAAGLAFWCRQPVGVFLCVGMYAALLLIMLRRRADVPRAELSPVLRRLGNSWLGRSIETTVLFGGGVLAINGVILFWLWTHGAVVDWWKQSIVFAKVFGESYGHSYTLKYLVECLFPGGDMRVWSLLAIPVAIQAIRSGIRFLDPKAFARSFESAAAFLAATVAVTSWLQYLPIPCNYHCYWASIPMYGVFAYVFYASRGRTSRFARSLVAVSVIVALFHKDVAWRVESIPIHLQQQSQLVSSIQTLRGMHTTPAEARSYDALASVIQNYLKARPNGTVVTTSRHALFPALAIKQATYHPFYVMWDEIMPKVYPEGQAVRDKYIKNSHPLVIGPLAVPEYVRVASLWWGGMYDIFVPRDSHPTEFVECDGSNPCSHRPL